MADTPGTSSTSSPPPVLPETLRAEINNAFNQWQRSCQGGAGRRQTSKNPEPLRGEKTGLMSRQEEYTAWKQGLQICWTIDPTVFDTERKKLLHLASLIDGRARQERLIDINDIINGTSIHTTSDSFLSKLDGLYISVDVAREASIRFDKLKMTDKMSLSAFYYSLEHLGTACHKQPREMVAAMKTKVSYNLQRLLMQDSNPCSLTDVDGLEAEVFEVWSQNLRENEHLLGSKMNSSFTQPYTSPTNTSSAVPASSDPMDLDAFKNTRSTTRRGTSDLVSAIIARNLVTQGGPGFAGSEEVSAAMARIECAPAGRGNQHSNQYPNNRVGSYNRNNFQEYGSRGSYSNNNNAHTTFYPKQQLNTFQGFVETESLAPSESASNTSPHNTSTSPINDYTGKAQPPH
ncbi:hypothetical protein DID88_009164 [Monilinia fructigena]|uniref:Uncharacterized protein n=1 Tax=Monilinia fructigena TaxID=38457 RepID=A0A395ICW2_9HELO|nr:hypothetical protein DID88_009164 [Monilinia fructigena]